MSNFIKPALVITLIALLAGCAQPPSKQDIGTVTGGVVGGLIGSRFGGGSGQAIATAGGVLIGAIIGGKIGQYMDRQDQLEVNQALESVPTNQSTSWTNPDTGAQYTVQPTRTYYAQNNQGITQPCREYTTTALIGGKRQQVYGTACRMDDGSWKSAN